jgi:orotate phosphoribosyltransferase-like protein
MNTEQIQRARELRKKGQSLRQIGAEVGVAAATVARALKNANAEESPTLEKIRQERLKKLRAQNERLRFEMRKIKTEWVRLEDIKAEVIKANFTVKSQLLALPSRVAVRLTGITKAYEIERLLRTEITDALNELAYGFGAKDRDEAEQENEEEAEEDPS